MSQEHDNPPTDSVSDYIAESVRFVVFVDILGFSDAVRGWRGERADRLLDLIVGISSTQARFDIRTERTSVGGVVVKLHPEITTFSDHVVISYPLPDRLELPELQKFWTTMMLREAQRVVAQLAEPIMRSGLLLRGGAAIGPVMHEERVVIGPAMIEAYELESRVAKFPRVLVSADIVAGASDEDRRNYLRLDEDGHYHIDYLSKILEDQEDPSSWLKSAKKEADRSIEVLSSTSSPGEKWIWLRKELDLLPRSLPQDLAARVK